MEINESWLIRWRHAAASSAGWLLVFVSLFALLFSKQVPPSSQEQAATVAKIPRFSFANSVGMGLVEIPAGKFFMGIGQFKAGTQLGEARQRTQVTISKSFYLSVTEVTQKQYAQVMGGNPSFFSYKEKTENHPVDSVAWFDAMKFCETLGKKEGRTYRLPTSAEWEYAYRAGTRTRYFWGDDDSPIVDYGWIEPQSGKRKLGFPRFGTIPVQQLAPNPWGLYDLVGNVQEWVQDWENYDPAWSAAMPKVDPQGPPAGLAKIVRGGAFNDPVERGSATQGNAYIPDAELDRNGFRVVCEKDANPQTNR
ncbi:MAG: formylglycine-generating enzyme family protein [Verrucomicrobia bacterium]|nr:formylglycine-generating enzyme family protein [Verrucomicrobiota bacterium]